MPAEEVSRSKCFGCAVLRYKHESHTLGGLSATFSLIVPPNAHRSPLLIYLSGLTCTDENFIQKAGAARGAAAHGVIIAVPDTSPRGAGVAGEDESWDLGTGAGFYLDATTAGWEKHYRCESYVVKELGAVVKEVLGEKVDLERVSVFGHSMGGHGALVLALRHPGTFRSVSAFAPIANASECPWGKKAFSAYLGGDVAAWREYDATWLMKKRDKGGLSGDQPILIDQGLDDGFLADGQLRVREFEGACKSAGQEVDLRMREGYDHGYFFIATFVDEHIAYHASILKE